MGFIVFEGIDGSGKTTQIKLLADYLLNCNVPHIVTKEPTDGSIGTLARNVVRGAETLSVEALALLFAADRAEHISREIQPALQNGLNVLCDRYVYSNITYQDCEPINFHHLLKPNLTIFIDTDPEECHRRIISTRHTLEIYDSIETGKKLRAKYMEAFDRYKDGMPVIVVDGNLSEQNVFDTIKGLCHDFLKFP